MTMTGQKLLEAIRARDTRRAEALLGEDASLAEARTPEGTSALMLALYLRLEDLADQLVAAGAQPDIFEATVLGDQGRVRALLEEAPERLEAQAPDGFTPLHLAAHFGQLGVLGVLLGRGAHIEAEAANEMANRPLHAAAAGCQEGAVRILVGEGARVDAPDSMGNTPLHIAAANGHAPTVQRLLAAGADPQATNQDGDTPRAVAEERGFEAVAALLPQAEA